MIGLYLARLPHDLLVDNVDVSKWFVCDGNECPIAIMEVAGMLEKKQYAGLVVSPTGIEWL